MKTLKVFSCETAYVTVEELAKKLELNKYTKSGKAIAYADPAFQANRGNTYRWARDSQTWFLESIFIGANIQSITIVNVKSCYDYAKESGDKNDLEYFGKLYEEGVRWLIVDGANRLNTISLFKENKIKLSDFQVLGQDDSRLSVTGGTLKGFEPRVSKFFLNRAIPITFVGNCTRKELSDIFKRVNSGQPLNDAEYRNSFCTPIANIVRDIADYDFKHRKTLTNRESSYAKRRKYDDYIATLLTIYVYGIKTMAGKKIKLKMYNKEVIEKKDTEAQAHKFTEFYNKVVNLFGVGRLEKLAMQNYCTLMDIFIFLHEVKKEDNLDLDPSKAFVFFEKWLSLVTNLYQDKKTEYDCVGICTNLNKAPYKRFQQSLFDGKLNGKRLLIHREKAKELDLFSYFIKKDKKRHFTQKQKLFGTVQQGFKDSYTGEKISLDETDFGSKYEADHSKPWSKGGETTEENLVVTEKSQNRLKSDSVV